MAVPSSDNSVVTMWNWKGPPPWVNDDRITEIQIQHSIFGYPENFVFFAGERFTDNSIWQHEWKDLIPGITHYFSIFALATNGDGDDIRYAPIKAKVKLPGTAETGKIYSRIRAINIDNTPVFTENPVTLNVSNTQWAVVYFDIPENVYIVNASINVTVGVLTEITFVPLDGILPYDDMEKWNSLQNNSIVKEHTHKTYTASQASYNIREVVKAAVVGPEKAILIRTTDASNFTLDNNASAPIIIADIIK